MCEPGIPPETTRIGPSHHINAICREAAARGLRFSKPARMHADGSWSTELRDPDGNAISLMNGNGTFEPAHSSLTDRRWAGAVSRKRTS